MRTRDIVNRPTNPPTPKYVGKNARPYKNKPSRSEPTPLIKSGGPQFVKNPRAK